MLQIKLLSWLSAFIDFFRFIERARARRRQELEDMRAHTLELVDTVLARVEAAEKLRSAAQIESAKALQAQSDALRTWLEMFKVDSQDRSPGVTVRPSDEADAEEERYKQKLRELGYPVDGTPHEQMAFLLAHELIEAP